MPKVSIIIPVYKSEAYLHKCLSSVVNQTLRDIEIIVVNNASPDNSQYIIDKFAESDTRIKLIKNKENEGICQARNAGLKIAEGEYAGFLDADDWVKPQMFESMYRAAVKNSADMVICNSRSVCEGRVHPPRFSIAKELIHLEKTGFDNYMYNYYFPNRHGYENWNKLYKLGIIRKNDISFDGRITFAEDAFFNLEYLLFTNTICCLDIPLHFYLNRKDSFINIKNPRLLQDSLLLLDEFYRKACLKKKLHLIEAVYPYLTYHCIDYVFSARIRKENTSIRNLNTEFFLLKEFPFVEQCMDRIHCERKTIGKYISSLLILKRSYFLLSFYKYIQKKLLA
ncbi:MAG: glycosyltransferase [Clostridia bacterium]|nr:glycosyltransferase [Clostridia bacterium]